MRLRHAAILVAVLVLIVSSPALAQYYNRQPQFQPFGGPPEFQLPFDATRLIIQIVAAGAGFGIGLFFSPAFRAARAVITLIVLIGAVLFALFGPYPFADLLNIPIAIFSFCAMLGLGFKMGMLALQRGPSERPTSFGSAQWANYDLLRSRKMFGTAGFLLGEFVDRAWESGNLRRSPLVYSGARHLLTVAPTRSGKGVSSIIPNLLGYEGSAFIVDPKGENALVTALRRGAGIRGVAGLGQDVFLIDPWNIAAGKLGMTPASFNPLDWIIADDPDAIENAFLLADAMVPEENKGGGDNRFWDDETKGVLTGLILYVATAPEEAAHRHLGRVRDILVSDEETFMAVLTKMFNHPNPVVASTAQRTASKEPKLRSNVLTSAQAHTHWLDSPRIRASLARTDVRFEDLKTRPTSVYLILPADRLKTFDRWLRLLIQQAIMVNARNIEQKPAKPILFLLDEMAAIGRLTSVEQAYGLMAGFGMQLWGIVQDLSQLERIYDKGWQTFISNSGVIQYFGSRDKMTAEYFSTLCGVTTTITRNLSTAIGEVIGWTSGSSSGAGGGSSSSGSSGSRSSTYTTSYNESQRKLAYPDELMVLKGNRQIIFIENLDPVNAEKIVWYEHDQFKELGFNLHLAPPIASNAPGLVPPSPPSREPMFRASRD